MHIFLKRKVKRLAAGVVSVMFLVAAFGNMIPAEFISVNASETDPVFGAVNGSGNEETSAVNGISSGGESPEIENMEEESSELKDDLEEINQELLTLGGEIADVEEKIDNTNGRIEMTKEQLAIAKSREEQQYEDMKLRIKYMYENGDESFLELLCSAEGMTDFLNKVDFIQNVSEYDRDKLQELQDLQQTIAGQDKVLAEEQRSHKELEEKLAGQQEELRQKAAETSTDLDVLTARIEQMKEEAARKAAEEAARQAAAKAAEEKRKAQEAAKQEAARQEAARREAAKAAQQAAQTNSQAAQANYQMPSGSGVLTKYKGVNYFNGHKETYYSQRVLPGGGLNIPGRHVAEDGTIRDENGYICVASSDYPKGTVVQTSLGAGKVYDTGCAKGTIDLYTDW